ncbi:MAG: carbohydrate kinase family protein [Chloroflexi bacterium]|nr:carbohydrate kinase family protein [Chloroflexota bacterium]
MDRGTEIHECQRGRTVMAKFDVVGLGVSTVDVVTLVEHFPAKEEVQRAFDMTVQGGGPVATAIVTLAGLGARTAMIDMIGDDWRGALIRGEFQRKGVCTDFIRLSEGHTSSTACVLVSCRDEGARSIVYFPGTTPELSSKDVPRAAIESATILHVNGRHWDACLQAIRVARDAGVEISFDGGAHRFRSEMRQIVPFADICIVARDFAERYTQETDIWKAADILLRSGPNLVVVTEGIRGSWVFPREGRPFHQPAYLLPNVVDTTGCGDVYHGAFLFGLLQGLELERIASFASAAAALNSQYLGGRSGIPDLKQVEAFLAQVSPTECFATQLST